MDDATSGVLSPVFRNKHSGRDSPLKTVPCPKPDPSIAPIINVLDRLFDNFNEEYFNSQLLKPVITLSKRNNSSHRGSCTEKYAWTYENANRYFEINICPECLNEPVENICEILLHQMLHLFNRLNGVIDCTSNGQYHNKFFKKSAEEHGLTAEQVPRYGYAKTSLKPKTMEYIKSLDLTAFKLYRDVEPEKIKPHDEKAKKQSSLHVYFCPQCKDIIQAKKEVCVRCEACNMLFRKQS